MDKMTGDRLREWLDKIVPVGALGIELIWCDPDHWHITAPLDLNSNHMGTGFGGSIATVATLAGWIQTWLLLENTRDYDIVIAKSTVTFVQPVTAAFKAVALAPAAQSIDDFQRSARAQRQATITVRTEVFSGEQKAAEFCGDFVALRKKS